MGYAATFLPFLLVQAEGDPFQVVDDVLNSDILRLAVILMALFLLVLWLSLVYWTVKDAARRGSLRWYWGIVSFMFPFAGTLVYMMVRPPDYLDERRARELEIAILQSEASRNSGSCPRCSHPVSEDFVVCPECGHDLKDPCEECSRPLMPHWKRCPYCRTAQKERRPTKER